MAGQGLGEFAGAFGQAFTESRQQADTLKEKKKFAKLQAQLVEMQLNQAENVADAQQRVSDMMSGQVGISPTTTSPGGRTRPNFVAPPEGQVEEFTQGREAVAPMGLTEMLANPEGLLAMLQSGNVDVGTILKEQGMSASRQLNKDMMDLFSPGGGSGGIDGMIPEGVTMTPSGPRLDFGPDPERTTTQQDELTAFNVGTFGQEALTAVRLSKSIAASNLLGFGASMAKGAKNLQSNLANIGQKVGFDSPEYMKALAEFDEIDKLYATVEAQESAKWSRDNPNATPTDAVRRQINQRVPTTDKQPPANFRLMANILERELNENRIKKVPMTGDQVAQAEDAITQLRTAADNFGSQEKPDPTPQAVDPNSPTVFEDSVTTISQMTMKQVTNLQEKLTAVAESPEAQALMPEVKKRIEELGAEVASIAKMGKEELGKIMLSGGELSDEALDAAEKRWNELNGN